MQETSRQIVNHIRIMIEEAEHVNEKSNVSNVVFFEVYLWEGAISQYHRLFYTTLVLVFLFFLSP